MLCTCTEEKRNNKEKQEPAVSWIWKVIKIKGTMSQVLSGLKEVWGADGVSAVCRERPLKWWVVQELSYSSLSFYLKWIVFIFGFPAEIYLGEPGRRRSFLPFFFPLSVEQLVDGEQLAAADPQAAGRWRCCSLSLEAGGGWDYLNARIFPIIASKEEKKTVRLWV